MWMVHPHSGASISHILLTLMYVIACDTCKPRRFMNMLRDGCEDSPCTCAWDMMHVIISAIHACMHTYIHITCTPLSLTCCAMAVRIAPMPPSATIFTAFSSSMANRHKARQPSSCTLRSFSALFFNKCHDYDRWSNRRTQPNVSNGYLAASCLCSTAIFFWRVQVDACFVDENTMLHVVQP